MGDNPIAVNKYIKYVFLQLYTSVINKHTHNQGIYIIRKYGLSVWSEYNYIYFHTK